MRILLLGPLLLLTAAAPGDERRFMVSSFDRLRVDGGFEVEVVPGAPAAVAIGDRAALDRVAVRVDSGTMIVSAPASTWDARKDAGAPPAKVRVSVPALRAAVANGNARIRIAEMRGARVDLGLNGAGSIEIDGMRADELSASLSGTGAMTIAGTARRARLRTLGMGSIDAGGLTADEATLVSESSGTIRINVRYVARATALGSGAIEVAGKPECHVGGPGPITCAGKTGD